jgi:hypothetical protein
MRQPARRERRRNPVGNAWVGTANRGIRSKRIRAIESNAIESNGLDLRLLDLRLTVDVDVGARPVQMHARSPIALMNDRVVVVIVHTTRDACAAVTDLFANTFRIGGLGKHEPQGRRGHANQDFAHWSPPDRFLVNHGWAFWFRVFHFPAGTGSKRVIQLTRNSIAAAALS